MVDKRGYYVSTWKVLHHSVRKITFELKEWVFRGDDETPGIQNDTPTHRFSALKHKSVVTDAKDEATQGANTPSAPAKEDAPAGIGEVLSREGEEGCAGGVAEVGVGTGEGVGVGGGTGVGAETCMVAGLGVGV